MRYLIDFDGHFDELKALVEPCGARLLPTHPLRYAAMALEAQASSVHHRQSPAEYLRELAARDGNSTQPLKPTG